LVFLDLSLLILHNVLLLILEIITLPLEFRVRLLQFLTFTVHHVNLQKIYMKTAVICEKCVKTAVICGKWVKTAVICGKCVKTAVIRREYMKAAIFWRKLVKTHLSRSKYVKASRICRKTAKKILSAVKPDARNQPVLSLGLTTASDSPAHSAVGGAARVVPSHFLSHRADFYNAVCPYRWHPVPDVCNGKCPAWSWEVGGSVNLSHFFTSHL